MAYKDAVFYNLDAHVGWGCPNNRTDVMLVQFLLKEVLNHVDLVAARPPGNDMQVDGKFGKQTETWIRAFQSFLRSKGRAIIVDGKVNSAPPDYHAKVTGEVAYTIAHLNATYRRRWRMDHDYLDRCARVPSELRGALTDRFAD